MVASRLVSVEEQDVSDIDSGETFRDCDPFRQVGAILGSGYDVLHGRSGGRRFQRRAVVTRLPHADRDPPTADRSEHIVRRLLSARDLCC